LSLRAVAFVFGFLTVNASIVPRDDAIRDVLSFTVIKQQVNGENVMRECLREVSSSFFFPRLLLKRQEL
jgi:hypothetical protein